MYVHNYPLLVKVYHRTYENTRKRVRKFKEIPDIVSKLRNEKFIPYCIEPSLGADRVVLAFLIDAYDEEEIGDNSILAVKKGQDIVLLDFEDIFMIRVEDKQNKVYTEDKDYLVKKPLYQIEENLDSNFVRVSKTTIVNLRKIKRVAPSLRGMMFIELKNGLKDNISRKYLSDFKSALDL